MTLKYLLKKEFLQIFRNKFLLRLIIIMPVIQLIILPWAATFDQKDISLSIVDNDKSPLSTKMIHKITGSGFFILTDYSSNYPEALVSVENNEADLILEIAPNFEKDIVNGQTGNILLAIDAVNGQKAGLGMSYITQIINDFTAEELYSQSQHTPVQVEPYYRFNKTMNYQSYMVPGILGILITMLGGMLSAMNIVREKEIGTMEQINVTPVTKFSFILGKLIPFWIIGLVILTIGMLLAYIVYGLIPAGNFLNIYLFSFVYLLVVTGLGLTISNFAKSQQQAMFVILFFLIIFILLSGLFTPISSMPQWSQIITKVNPLAYFVEVMRLIYLKGSTFYDILPLLLKTLVFMLIINTLAIVTYRKKS